MRQSVEARRLIATAVDRVGNISLVARVFGVTRKTVYRWCKRRKRLKDRKGKPKKGRVTEDVELSILRLRLTFEWGTARIQQGLFSLPAFMREAFPELAQGVKLSRTTINNVLKKHRLNGYKREQKTWKFFRAKRQNELWQIDLKGGFILHGKKHRFLVVIDDYSRYLLLTHHFDHVPTTQEIFDLLLPLIERHRPKSILSDNGSQFRKTWERLCKQYGMEPLFAHPYYPQDKGKVERAIRNIN